MEPIIRRTNPKYADLPPAAAANDAAPPDKSNGKRIK